MRVCVCVLCKLGQTRQRPELRTTTAVCLNVCVCVCVWGHHWRKVEEAWAGTGKKGQDVGCLDRSALRRVTSGRPAVVGVFWATCPSKPWVCLVLLLYDNSCILVIFCYSPLQLPMRVWLGWLSARLGWFGSLRFGWVLGLDWASQVWFWSCGRKTSGTGCAGSVVDWWVKPEFVSRLWPQPFWLAATLSQQLHVWCWTLTDLRARWGCYNADQLILPRQCYGYRYHIQAAITSYRWNHPNYSVDKLFFCGHWMEPGNSWALPEHRFLQHLREIPTQPRNDFTGFISKHQDSSTVTMSPDLGSWGSLGLVDWADWVFLIEKVRPMRKGCFGYSGFWLLLLCRIWAGRE